MEKKIDPYISSDYEEDDFDNTTINSITTFETDEYVSFMERFTEDELAEAEEEINERIDAYIETNTLKMSNPDFVSQLVEELSTEILDEWIEMGVCVADDIDDLEEWIESLTDNYFEIQDIPKRQESSFFLAIEPDPAIEEKIKTLTEKSTMAQKSAEWHSIRQNLITASNAWKAFATDAQQNSLIYEKCKPPSNPMQGMHSNTNSTLHWGQKYEPLSVAIYEEKTNVKVGEFGCLVHPAHHFLGASPDGIVIQGESKGCMIEVKNIVNRDITGIPLDAYWIQMQLQMEVCDLNECDFIETRFKEFPGEEEFYADNVVNAHKYKGVMLYFLPKITMESLENTDTVHLDAHYVYMPLSHKHDRDSVEKWIEENAASRKEKYALWMRVYWYLDEYSCIRVRRNRVWFGAAVKKLEDVWSTVLRERVEGYDHRAPKSKKQINFGNGGGMSPHLFSAADELEEMMKSGAEFTVVKREDNDADEA